MNRPSNPGFKMPLQILLISRPARAFFRIGLITSVMAVIGLRLPADVKMPAIFGDHMVLQQGTKLPVWGAADAGETVTVTLGKESVQTKAADDGKWHVDLAPLPANSKPVTLTVTGKNTLTFTDVLVGDVWVCSGQSNMGFSLDEAQNAATEIPQANDPALRLFVVPMKTSLEPMTDVTGTWKLCTPASAEEFSAVGYFFGKTLRAHLHRPIGLIGTYWGGTPAQAWTSLSALRKEPVLKSYVDLVDQRRADFAKLAADYPVQLAAYREALAKWNQTGGKDYLAAMQTWKKETREALAANRPTPPRPIPVTPMPEAPVPPDGGRLPDHVVQRHDCAVDSLRHQGSDLVPGGSQRSQGGRISHFVSDHDYRLAREMGRGRFPVSFRAAGRL